MAKTKIAINGFGRIGRIFFRVANERPELDIVAINDLGDPDNLAYLLKYDTAYGRAPFDIKVKKQNDRTVFEIDGKKTVAFLSQKEPHLLPWKTFGVDIVVESSGVFDTFEKSKAHLQAGAKRVVITAPVKDSPPAGMECRSAISHQSSDEGARLSRIRQARQSRLERRHLEGKVRFGSHRGDGARPAVRPQDRYRGGRSTRPGN